MTTIQPTPEREFLSAKELAEWTGVPASSWRHFGSNGYGPASFKLGRRRLWRKSEVQAWIEAQEK
jgi:predicted DNA-binding transcriptional regulator AlpA